MSLPEFYSEIVKEAQMLGFSLTQIQCFMFDIEECYYNNKSVSETVSEIF